MAEPKRYLVTAALPYANGPLHIGHLAGAYLPPDIYVRYLRMMGKDVVFVCGSDEHGAAITIRAKADGVQPQEIVDRYHNSIKSTFDKVGVNFDIFHRTSAELHHQTAQDFFRVLNDKDEFLLQKSEQYFDEEAQQFLADRYITGTCPKCGHDEAYGDQCENCGSTLSPTELINPKSKMSGAIPVMKETSHWYLPLDKYEDWLRPWIEDGILEGETHHNPKDWKTHVLGQCRSWIDSGLQPRAMTRDLSWGVDVPQEIEGSEGKKLYVWLDAPIGYISATKQWAADNGKDWETYWKDEDTKLVHFIGKDNIVFHCIIFPVILKAHGDYILPENVPANQFLNLEGRKISTSKNWAIWVHEFVDEYPELVDILRYYMIKTMPENKDSEFTWKGFQEVNDTELVNNLGGFIQRVTVLINKNYDGVIPEIDESLIITCSADKEQTTTFKAEYNAIILHLEKIASFIEKYEFRNALTELMSLSSLGNGLLQNNAPWALIKTDPEATKVVLNIAAQLAAVLSVAMRPFMPHKSDELRAVLGLDSIDENQEWLTMMDKLRNGIPLLAAGHQIQKPKHLFTRLSKEWVEEQIQKLEDSQVTETSYAPLKEMATFDDFQKMDIRTGIVTTAEKVKKAKKLLKLTVNIGFEERTVVSGIAEFFKPEDVIGQEVVLLANLAPRKIRGVESQGMILMAENDKGELAFVSPSTGFGNGFVVR
ncbi:MAG: methionyl-tRNA synthetase [Maribacter sp.]|jgi:methionyl-tRNA synthetase